MRGLQDLTLLGCDDGHVIRGTGAYVQTDYGESTVANLHMANWHIAKRRIPYRVNSHPIPITKGLLAKQSTTVCQKG